MSDLLKYSEHLKLNHYNYITWRNLSRVDLPAVHAYEIAISDEHHPIGAGNGRNSRSAAGLENASERAILGAHADNAKSKSATSTL